MRENADQNNSKYGHFLRSGFLMAKNYSVYIDTVVSLIFQTKTSIKK